MRAIQIDAPGAEDVMVLREAKAPEPRDREVRIRVAATAVNRADLLQRRGHYPPPPGASAILGLECAGVVDAVGEDAHRFAPGARVMALLTGGGYAEAVVVDERQVMPVPEDLDLVAAAAIPEVWLTAYLNVFRLGGLAAGGALLVHGGGSGVGTAAIQLARAKGATVLVTVGSPSKAERCRALGADAVINYREEDFATRVRALTSDRGVDVVLDSIGGAYLESNLRCLAMGGRLVVIGTMGGRTAELDLGRMIARRLTLIGSALRSRPVAEKGELVAAFEREVLPLFAAGRVKPVIDRVLPLAEAPEAHRVVAESAHFGKVVLKVGEV
ncbi:MAG TPA: NAD(P)H-quinone oxidoreductase [Polyangia bacterium]|jgi:putative PIG3 family NAD(P)H quinone oxidoreductase